MLGGKIKTNPHPLNGGGVHNEHADDNHVARGTSDSGERHLVDGERSQAITLQQVLGGLLNMEEVVVMAPDVEEGEQEDSPGNCLVECDIFVQGDDTADERVPHKSDEVPADCDQNNGAVKVKHGGTTSCLRGKARPKRKKEKRGNVRGEATSGPREESPKSYHGQTDAKDGTGDGESGIVVVVEERLEEEHAVDRSPGDHEEDLE